MKRWLSLVLAMCLTFTILPTPVQAENDNTTSTEAQNQISVEGTNDLGTLFSDSLEEVQAQDAEEENVGYAVHDLVIEGSTATVTYKTLEDANLVVAVYTEDGTQMLASGSAAVTAESTSATVNIEGEIPQYFLAKAFLLDDYDFSPLGGEFTTPLYTQEMQELLASTADDYEDDRVLALGDTRDTNFAVYAPDTVRITPAQGVNQLTDNGDGTYTVTQADDQFTTLQPGDIFAYNYTDSNVLIAKVGSIQVTDSTVTITEDSNIEIGEVFSQMKVETVATSGQFSYSADEADPGISYTGTGAAPASLAANGVSPLSEDLTINFVLKKQEIENADGDSIEISGLLSLEMDFSLDYYITLNQFYVDFTTESELNAGVEVEGKLEHDFRLGRFGVSPIPGVYIDFSPSLVFKAKGKAMTSFYMKSTLQVCLPSDADPELHCSIDEWRPINVDAEGTIFLGLDFKPAIGILSHSVLELEVELQAGAELKAEMIGQNFDPVEPERDDETHACAACLDGSVDAVFKIKPKITFLEKLEFESSALSQKGHILDFYYSVDHNEFGLGFCPYRSFRVALTTYDAVNHTAPNVSLTIKNEVKTTNENGVAEYWLPGGDYFVLANWTDGNTRTQAFTVTESCGVAVPYEDPPAATLGVFGSLSANDVADRGELREEGNITNSGTITGHYQVWGDGTLIIDHPGSMDVRPAFSFPWSKWNGISRVIFVPGVTAIGQIFLDNTYLQDIDLPEGVKILYCSFIGSSSLEHVRLPDSLESIQSAFQRCTSLQSIVIPQNVTELTSAFCHSSSLKSVEILSQPESLGGSFAGCSALEELTVPESVTSLLYEEFAGCSSLKEITLSESLETIASNAFKGCSSLASITIPQNVRSVDSNAFIDCSNLKQVIFTGDMPAMGNLFSGCSDILVCYPLENTSWSGPDLATYKRYNPEATFLPYTYDEGGNLVIHYPDPEPEDPESGSGTLEGGLTWTLQEGTLTISGNGAMPDFTLSTDSDDRPWINAAVSEAERGQKITRVVIEPGVTRIGSNAFRACRNLTSLELPDTLTEIGQSSFNNCTALESVSIPDSVLTIEDYAFCECNSLRDLTFGANLESIGSAAFTGLAVTELDLPDSVWSMGTSVFARCAALKEIRLPASLARLPEDTLTYCSSLETIIMPESLEFVYWNLVNGFSSQLRSVIFTGNLPTISDTAFPDELLGNLTFYYPADNATWTSEGISALGVTCEPYTPGQLPLTQRAAFALPATTETARTAHNAPVLQQQTVSDTDQQPYEQILPADSSAFSAETYAAVGGDYATTEDGWKTASFTGLLPGGSYVLLALADIKTATPLAAENLLYITQGTADENGDLQFSYRPRVTVATSYVVACGPSTKNLADAQISVPALYANGAAQTVHPTIVYDGETLTEGVDYILVGQVSATEPGTYACQVRGIYNYTGLVFLTYTLNDSLAPITSDIYRIEDDTLYLEQPTDVATLLSGLNGVDIAVAMQEDVLEAEDPVGTGATLSQAGGPGELVVVLYGDLDGSGTINSADLLYMRRAMLHIATLEGPVLLAATPVSGSSIPTAGDMLQLRRLLLHLTDSVLPAA